MPLSDQTTSTLQSAVADLEAQERELREELDRCIQAIGAIRQLLPKKAVSESLSLNNGDSFASCVLGALMSLGRVSAPKEVANLLVDLGYEYRGKSDFGSVVANELYRQDKAKNSPVVKVGRGLYGTSKKEGGNK